ncbi:MAG: DUF3368 domain-containing protein [Acidobacteriota bacterium]
MRNRALVTVLERDLDLGESESIALAVDLTADLVPLDEKEARREAERLGLNVMGVVGVLLEAKARGLVSAVRPLLDSLRHDAGFWLSDAVYQSALGLAGESAGAQSPDEQPSS